MIGVVPVPSAPLRVMLCDDSPTMRLALKRMLESDPGVRVVAQAANGADAVEKARAIPADLLLMDIEMPVMDGFAALAPLREARPAMRVVLTSANMSRGAVIARGAMRLGAADYIRKPGCDDLCGGDAYRHQLLTMVKDVGHKARAAPEARRPIALRAAGAYRPRLLAIGASTGGPEALAVLLQGLGLFPLPVVITQHMKAPFLVELAEQLNRIGTMPCAVAGDGGRLAPGRVYLAPGDRHLTVEGGPDGLRSALSSAPPENSCRPAVDPMLRSAARATGGRTLAVMLTGMGEDGLAGTRALVAQGGTAIAQDEASSVVWGMPGAIAAAGLCHAVIPLREIARKALGLASGGLS